MQKLEKLNSAIDIIPLQQCSSMDNNSGRRVKPRMEELPGGGRIVRDPLLLPRVRQVKNYY